ncbi:MAG: TetR/AcrR family transcriptional regulator [Acidimicrobiia bacterium]
MAKRTNQIDRTRMAIIDAATEMVFGTTDPADLTMQNIADTAGVSHRTLYRYFPTRTDLINAVGATYDAQLDSDVADSVKGSFDGWVSSAQQVADFGALTEADLLRSVSVSIAAGEWRTDRDMAYWELFRKEFPNLDGQTAREDFAVLRSLLWAVQTVFMRQRFELTPAQVASAINRAVKPLLIDIRRRDSEAKA